MRRLIAGGRWRVALPLAGLLIVFASRTLPAQPAASAGAPAAAPAALADDASLVAMLEALRAADATYDYAAKADVARKLADSGDPSAPAVLQALLEDRLYVRTADERVFIVTSADDALSSLELVDPVSRRVAGNAPRDALAKIGTNNSLRRTLRILVARFALSSPDATTRLGAVEEMLRSLDEANVARLRAQMSRETDPRVKEEIETGLALAALDGTDTDRAARLAAIHTLSGKLRPEARNRLQQLLDRSPDGTYAEPDAEVRQAAAAAVRRIDDWRTFYSYVETLFFGLSLGSVLVLAAIGLAITFGVMGVINMAHGELMMLGAYTTYVTQLLMPNHIGASIIVAIPAAFVVSGLAGVAIERTIIRYLYGRPLETLLATFGISLVLQQLVRSIFTALNRSVETPAWMSGTWQINGALAITYNRLDIVVFTFAVFGVLLVVLKRTRLGLDIRAVSQNRTMAQAMGIRTDWVDAMTFGLGAGIAGVAGVALSQLTNVGPNLGQSYIIDSFMVVVFGGVGNLWGTFIGGMTMGVVNKVLEPYAGAVLAKIFVLIALILFIQRRPRGLFPQTGRAADGQS
ncbi:MAG TPA: urea ABC transporter permease subunit UrtB [Vicinamibacterales bacterium]|nr:urea ABC transporter permease subunit UrtB [Vicinamibacterales bacterium]